MSSALEEAETPGRNLGAGESGTVQAIDATHETLVALALGGKTQH